MMAKYESSEESEVTESMTWEEYTKKEPLASVIRKIVAESFKKKH